MLIIAGTPVTIGDNLYSRRAGAFGTIISVQENIATLRVTRAQGHRDFTVEQGGLVGGERDLYWFAPIPVDLPKGQGAKAAKVQAVVQTLIEVL